MGPDFVRGPFLLAAETLAPEVTVPAVQGGGAADGLGLMGGAGLACVQRAS
jgi:hypothetical protein